MSYLQPPPAPAPVVVMKDVGGYVNEYRDQTDFYRATNREVRLHECRSACTLALSLPNVCVYPSSILKFHKAYDPTTKIPNEEVSGELFSSYPPLVRARLGALTREYKVLTGAELIRLGVRNCAEPGRVPETLIARATPSPKLTPKANGSGGPGEAIAGLWASLTGDEGEKTATAAVGARPVRVMTASVAPRSVAGASPVPVSNAMSGTKLALAPALEAVVTPIMPPLPPRRPAGLGATGPQLVAGITKTTTPVSTTPVSSLPPLAPDVFRSQVNTMPGSVPILAAGRLTPYPQSYRIVPPRSG